MYMENAAAAEGGKMTLFIGASVVKFQTKHGKVVHALEGDETLCRHLFPQLGDNVLDITRRVTCKRCLRVIASRSVPSNRISHREGA